MASPFVMNQDSPQGRPDREHAAGELRRSGHILLIAAAVMLILCFACGGDSAKGNLGMMTAQMLAIPLLILGTLRAAQRGVLRSARWGVLVALLIALLPLLQLLPIPAWLWGLPAERLLLLPDLQAAGIASPDQRWTLSPSATERDFYFLLPGLALFFCMLGLGRSAWQRMLGLLVIVCLANLALAFAQMAAGQDSFLNPYPDFAPALGGVFANRNHQADMLAISLMVVVVVLLDSWKQARNRNWGVGRIGALALICLILVLALPLVGSRAGVIVAMVMLIAALLSSGLPAWQTFRGNPWLQLGAFAALTIFVAGLLAAQAWMQADAKVEGSRHALMMETLRIGEDHAPLGSGIGTFVPAFQQAVSDALPLDSVVNNAHNEYAQWWLEAGIVGVLLMLLSFAVLIAALLALLRQPPDSRTRVTGMAAMMGIGVIALHSTVDYPLRTQAILAVFAVLAGITVAAAGNGRVERDVRS